MRRGGGGEAVSFGDDRSSLRRSRGEVAARSVDGGAMARGRWPLHRPLRERSPSPWLRHREEFGGGPPPHASRRAEQLGRDTSELQSLMRISSAVFCLKKQQAK